jgi:hypothetical protein
VGRTSGELEIGKKSWSGPLKWEGRRVGGGVERWWEVGKIGKFFNYIYRRII